MQGGCIADIGSCGTGFDSASGSVRTKKFRTKGSELADRKGEKNKAMPIMTRALFSGFLNYLKQTHSAVLLFLIRIILYIHYIYNKNC
ncbi:uncharacterized protein LOC113874724 [Abrus precatorius]|uniref:Uncharacterized protein LOC113874724 n=1 Tax=Abrus precatorius TaxID=3816 RepID=A0A8B8MND2_ABRPR|nr:uncharacterized protein LOC113874724 [Abrus precatorius]